jgi:hypothetical protein
VRHVVFPADLAATKNRVEARRGLKTNLSTASRKDGPKKRLSRGDPAYGGKLTRPDERDGMLEATPAVVVAALA